MARRLEWKQGVARFIYVVDTDAKTGKETPRFLNVLHIQQVYQNGEDVIIEMPDYLEIRVVNTNIQVFMDRFV